MSCVAPSEAMCIYGPTQVRMRKLDHNKNTNLDDRVDTRVSRADNRWATLVESMRGDFEGVDHSEHGTRHI